MRAYLRHERLPRGTTRVLNPTKAISGLAIVATSLLILFTCHAGTAEAHTAVQSVSASGKSLRITFSGPIRRGTIRATDKRGRVVSRGKGGRDPRNITRLIVPLKNVPMGKYRARWTMVAIDGHRQSGTIGFRVR